MIQVRGQEHKTRVETHYGFREAPFGVTPDPRFFYNDAAYMKSLAELIDGIKAKKGLMLVTGEIGTGKTILIRKLMRDLEAIVKFVFISSSYLTSYGLFDLITCDLGLPKKNTRLETIQELRRFLIEQIKGGYTIVLVVDEAQNIRDAVFESLCGLSNLETDNEKLLQIVLVGQPELMSKLSQPSLRQIKQRIAIQQRLSGLQTASEVKGYISHRLQVAGYNGPEIFTQGALDAIWRYSCGTPRRINIICDNSLASACEAGNRHVSIDVATKAAEEFQFTTPKDDNSAVPPTNIALKSEANSADTDDRIETAPVSPPPPEPVASPAEAKRNDTPFKNRLGLKWKIAGVFSGTMLILGILLVVAAYYLTERTLREQLDKRALAIATNLSDASAGHIIGKDLLQLNTLLRKYTFLDGLAYAFVQDSEGALVAHTLGTFPPELRQGLSVGKQRAASRRELSLRGKPIHEVGVPVLGGQIGSVHIGFWEDAMKNEIQHALLPFVGIIAIVPLVGMVFSLVVAHWVVRPITRLTKVAEKITRGDLETPGEYPKFSDEIGELARSLERMRASLKAAMSRLDHQSI